MLSELEVPLASVYEGRGVDRVLEIDSKAGEVVIRDTVLIVLGFIVGSNIGESADRFWVS
jgi:hypothetical protein